jgi:putative restriction endonuclease
MTNYSYNELIENNYNNSEIELYFLITNKTNNTNNRIGQEIFRNNLISRFNNKCIITGTNIHNACHIVPYSETHNMNINNGILLNSHHHSLFDSYYMTINPETFEIIYNNKITDSFSLYKKYLTELINYPEMKKYLIIHYNKFNEINNNN